MDRDRGAPPVRRQPNHWRRLPAMVFESLGNFPNSGRSFRLWYGESSGSRLSRRRREIKTGMHDLGHRPRTLRWCQSPRPASASKRERDRDEGLDSAFMLVVSDG